MARMSKEDRAKAMRDLYERRKANHECVRCGCDMLPEWGKVTRCPTCVEAMRKFQRPTKKIRQSQRKRLKEQYHERRARLVCVKCETPSKTVRCHDCTADHKQIQERSERRRRGESVPDGRRREKVTASPPPKPLRPWQRIISIAKHFDAVTMTDLREVLGLDDVGVDSAWHIVSRLQRKGLMRKVRGSRGSADTAYAVTPEGRRAA